MGSTEIPLNIAVVGSGLGGLCAALSLRRAGHQVTLYEQYDFVGEIGASVSATSNGSRWLSQWGVDIPSIKPVTLENLVMHDWETGKIKNMYGLGDYKANFGSDYYNFHRIDIHQALLKRVQDVKGPGIPCKLVTNHKAINVDAEQGIIYFADNTTVTADVIIAADGINSRIRQLIGITPQITPSKSSCYRCIISVSKLNSLGLSEFVTNNAIEFWGGFGINKIVLTTCHDSEMVSCYCFYSAEHNGLNEDGWTIEATPQQLVDTFPSLDPKMKKLLLNAEDIKMRRLLVHEEYPYWCKGVVGLLGDAAHPMLPDQSQAFCQAIEDAATLGLVFGRNFFREADVQRAFRLYELVRKDRATRVQSASALAREDLSERIGWSTGLERKGKLTIEELCGYDLVKHVRELDAALMNIGY